MRNPNPSPLMVKALESTVEELCAEFHGVFSRETIVRYLDEAFDAFGETPTVGPNFGVVIIRRFAKERLHALGQAEGLIEKTMPEVLFVCEHNAGRSQMAAALTHHLSQGRIGVRSAGSQPGEQIYPAVVEAMSEIGVDVTQEFPKPLSDEVVRAADAVITMGCGDACPIYPGKHYEDWQLTDPHDAALEDVRRIRDEISARVEQLLAHLQADIDAESAGAEELSEPVLSAAPAGGSSRWKRVFGRSS